MQKIATKVFICSSIAFGIFGILMIFTGPDSNRTGFALIIQDLFFVSIFFILPSFALSVAGKYLSDKS